jgi:hypothetical protein
MLIYESADLFSFPSLHQLSRVLVTPEFVPTDAQKAVLSLALKLLDLELSHQASEHPEFGARISSWLEENKTF